MKKKIYITEEESAKCRKVADAFEDLWKEWLDTKLFLMFEGTQLLEDEGFVVCQA